MSLKLTALYLCCIEEALGITGCEDIGGLYGVSVPTIWSRFPCKIRTDLYKQSCSFEL